MAISERMCFVVDKKVGVWVILPFSPLLVVGSFALVERVEIRLISEKICLFLAMIKSLNLFPLFFGYCKTILL